MSEQQDLPSNYFYYQLPNGIEMVGQYMPNLRSITFGFHLDAGVINEPEERPGLANLFGYMLFQGTRQKDARVLNEAFESLGVEKDVSVDMEITQIWARLVNTKFDHTLPLMHEILLMPTFLNDEIEHMRSIILQEIRLRDDEPESRIFELTQSGFYRDAALGRPLLGTTESVCGLQQQDLREFWEARYQPNNVLFSIAGNFEWDHVVEQMQTLFGSWRGLADPSPEPRLAPTSNISLEYNDGAQEHLGLMFPFTNYTDPDYYAGLVIGEILGGSPASRLFTEIREKRGLAYDIAATPVGNKYIGTLYINADTTPKQGHKCLKVIIEELQKLEKHGITPDELMRAKIQLKSEYILHNEGSDSRMNAIARSWWYERKLRTIKDVIEAIDAVTEEQVRHVLHRFSPLNPLTLAAIGPLDSNTLVGGIL